MVKINLNSLVLLQSSGSLLGLHTSNICFGNVSECITPHHQEDQDVIRSTFQIYSRV